MTKGDSRPDNLGSEDDPEQFDPFADDPWANNPCKVRDALVMALLLLVLPRGLSRSRAKNELEHNPQLLVDWIEDWKPLQPEVAELCSYLGIESVSKESFPWLFANYVNLGFSPEHAESAAKTLSQPRRGAPVSVRQTAVRALELRLADLSNWSWTRLGRELCTCDKSEHDTYCTQRIRQAAIALEKVLRKHGVQPALAKK
jgi:hypothetical protein